jgi:hypothetical protein
MKKAIRSKFSIRFTEIFIGIILITSMSMAAVNRTLQIIDTEKFNSYDTLSTQDAILIHPRPNGYYAKLPTRDLRYVSRSYESKAINKFGKALYFKMVLMTVSKKGSNDEPNHDFCHTESIMNVKNLKTQYSKKSGFWDFYYEGDNFSSHRVVNDTLYISINTNDPKIADWFKRNRDGFVSQLNK